MFPRPVAHENKSKLKNKKRCRRKRKHQNVPTRAHQHHDKPSSSTQIQRTQTIAHSSQHQLMHPPPPIRNGGTMKNVPNVQSAVSLWQKMYKSTVRWHCEHQNNYWRNLAEQRKREIDALQTALTKGPSAKIPIGPIDPIDPIGRMNRRKSKMARSKGEVDNITVDQSYVDFLVVTHRHQAELAQNKDPTDSGSSETLMSL